MDSEIISAALENIAREDEMASIRRILSRKRWTPGAPMAVRQRLFRHLLGRGFPTDLISKALGRHDDTDDQ